MGMLSDFFGAPMRLLLVEDDPEITAEFSRSVDQSNGDIALVSATSNESEVASLLRSVPVDCVILDETLTRRTWPQIVRDILASHGAMRIVVHTEQPNELLMQECLRAGARRPIRKHLALDQLVAQLESMMEDERRLRTALAQGAEATFAAAPAADRPRSVGRVVVCCSGYTGGAGKTTAAVNLAVWLANHPAAPMRTALLDLERGRGSIRSLFDPQMDAAPSILQFTDWASQGQIPPETLRSAIPRDTLPARKFHVSLIFGSGSYDRDEAVTPELVTTVVTSLRLQHDLVLIDLPGDATDPAVASLRLATDVLWFVRPDIRDFERHADILHLLRGRSHLDTHRFQAVLSFVPPGSRSPYTPTQIQQALGMRLMPWALPYDPHVAQGTPGHFPAIEDRTGPYMTGLRRIAEEIAPELRADPRPARRRPLLGLFPRR